MPELRVGVIGCGYWGPNLIRNFVEIPHAELIAVADLDPNRLHELKNRFPDIRYLTQEHRDLFDLNLHAVAIATPPHTHYSIAAECLRNGLHVLVEKPLTLDSDEARKLNTIAQNMQRILMVGHTFEYNPAVRALKEIVQSGELGEIYYVDAVRASLGLFQTHANVLWDLAPHDVSIFRYILDADPISVRAEGTDCVQAGIEDIAYAHLIFPGNIPAHIRTSWLDPHKTRRITVVGSKKMVIYDDVENLKKITIFNKGVSVIRHTDTYGTFQFAYHYGDVVSPYIHFEEPLRLQCLHFLECIHNGSTPQTDGYNGLRVVQILEAAQHSLQNNAQVVEIEYEPAQKRASLEIESAMA